MRLLTFGAKRLPFTKVINFSRGHRIVNKIKYFELLMNIRKLSSFLFHKTCRLIYTSPSGLQFNGNAHWMDLSIKSQLTDGFFSPCNFQLHFDSFCSGSCISIHRVVFGFQKRFSMEFSSSFFLCQP